MWLRKVWILELGCQQFSFLLGSFQLTHWSHLHIIKYFCLEKKFWAGCPKCMLWGLWKWGKCFGEIGRSNQKIPSAPSEALWILNTGSSETSLVWLFFVKIYLQKPAFFCSQIKHLPFSHILNNVNFFTIVKGHFEYQNELQSKQNIQFLPQFGFHQIVIS